MAADGSDNPILDMGLLGMMQPNPYLNASLNYNSTGGPKPLALPGFFTSGQTLPPTDAYGKPIARYGDEMAGANTKYAQQLDQYNAQRAAMGAGAPPPGTTTLNTPGPGSGGTINYAAMGSAGGPLQELMSNYQAAQAKLTPQQQYNQQQTRMIDASNAQQLNSQRAAQAAGGGFGNMAGGAFNGGQAISPTSLAMMTGQGGGAPAAPAGPTPPTPPDDRQAYLDALANPGPPTRVGAAVPASTPLGTPSVLNAFMAAHPGGGVKGAGGYDNSGFFSTLSNLKSA